MPWAFLLELRRHREGLLRRSDSGRHSQREITDFFRSQARQSDEQAAQQTSTCTRGILIDRATELGRSRRTRLRGSSRHRWRMRQRVRTILVRHGRRPVRVLTMEDFDEIRQRPMLDILGP